MTAYENFEQSLTDYLFQIGTSRIRTSKPIKFLDEDILIPTEDSVRLAYVVTNYCLDDFFSKPRGLIRLVGEVCKWGGVESLVNEIKDLHAERRELFEPIAKLCKVTDAGIEVRIQPIREWLISFLSKVGGEVQPEYSTSDMKKVNAVRNMTFLIGRFNSLLDREELIIKLFLVKGAKNTKGGEFVMRKDLAQLVSNLPQKNGVAPTQRARIVRSRMTITQKAFVERVNTRLEETDAVYYKKTGKHIGLLTAKAAHFCRETVIRWENYLRGQSRNATKPPLYFTLQTRDSNENVEKFIEEFVRDLLTPDSRKRIVSYDNPEDRKMAKLRRTMSGSDGRDDTDKIKM